jgi:thiol peroxidase
MGAGKDPSRKSISVNCSSHASYTQKRWCGNANVKNLRVLSDHRDASFGTAYGVLIKELRLLGRAEFLVDNNGVIRYIQIVREVSSEPDYEAVLSAVNRLH